jgi:metallopeptidase family M81
MAPFRSPRIAFLVFSSSATSSRPWRRRRISSRGHISPERRFSPRRARRARACWARPRASSRQWTAAAPWTPVPILAAMAEPNGPVEHGFFVEMLAEMRRRLLAALPLDGVYVCAHGAALTTEEDDPDGLLLALVREVVGPDVPVAATFDLHSDALNSVPRAISRRSLRSGPRLGRPGRAAARPRAPARG